MSELGDPVRVLFIRVRNIHENFTYIRGLAHAFTQNKIPAMFFKLDLQMDFDSVSWPFLLDVLREKGFGPRFCSWICAMFSSTNTNFFVSGD